MQWENPTNQLYAPWVAAWWVAGMAGLYWWASLCPAPEPKRPAQLRLVAVNGRLLGS